MVCYNCSANGHACMFQSALLATELLHLHRMKQFSFTNSRHRSGNRSEFREPAPSWGAWWSNEITRLLFSNDVCLHLTGYVKSEYQILIYRTRDDNLRCAITLHYGWCVVCYEFKCYYIAYFFFRENINTPRYDTQIVTPYFNQPSH